MKPYIGLAAVTLSAILCAGCSDLVSLNEFVAAEDSVMDPRLLGVWTHGDTTFAVQADGNAYTIRYFEKGPVCAKFQARMVRVGDARLLDVVEDGDDAFMLPAHFLVRVWPEGGTLYWTLLDSDWMKEEAGRRFATQAREKRRIITASGSEWGRTLLLLAADDRAYDGKRETLAKVQ